MTAPEFAQKDAALGYAQELIKQLQAEGHVVSFIDESAAAQIEGPPASTQPAAAGGAGGESEEALTTWLSAVGAAPVPATGAPHAPGDVAAGTGAEEDAPMLDTSNSAVEEGPGADALSVPLIIPPPPAATQDLTSADLVTPLTPDLWERARDVGAAGVPLMMGGDDLEDMQATVVVYRGAQGSEKTDRPVVWCKVRAAAEDKVLAAIAGAQGKQYMVVKKPVNMVGRAPFDEQKDVGGKIVQYAKSINRHVGEGSQIPDHTVSGVTELLEYLAQVHADPTLSEGERKLLNGYLQDATELSIAIMNGTKTPHKEYAVRKGGFTVLVEEKIPIPADPSQSNHFAVEERHGTRLGAQETMGIPYWDGVNRPKASGKEFVLDFGDGWTAIYRPHAEHHKVPWSAKGMLEIHAPTGADPTGIAEHLNRLYLHGEPMSRAESEATYLERNAWAQGLSEKSEYRAVQQHTYARLQMVAAELVMGGEFPADEMGMASAIRTANKQVLVERVHLLRRLFEKHLKLPDGGLVQQASYRPDPRWETVSSGSGQGKGSPGGYFVWERFDVGAQEIKAMFGGRMLGHHFTGNGWQNLKKIILGPGVLAAQEKRLQMGAAAGATASPAIDQRSGGAEYILLRVGNSGGFDIEWDPEVLLTRSDWFFRDADNYGATNPHDPTYKEKPSMDPGIAAKSKSGSNELAFKHGIGLFGQYAPRRINAGSHRKEVLGWFNQAGITHLGQRPVEEVVV